jgi:hypothetical protein
VKKYDQKYSDSTQTLDIGPERPIFGRRPRLIPRLQEASTFQLHILIGQPAPPKVRDRSCQLRTIY